MECWDALRLEEWLLLLYEPLITSLSPRSIFSSSNDTSIMNSCSAPCCCSLFSLLSSDELSDAFLSAVAGLFGPNDLSRRFTGAMFPLDNDLALPCNWVGTGVNTNDGPFVFELVCLVVVVVVVLATKLTRVSRHSSNSGSMARWDLRTRARMETQLVLSEEGIVGVTVLL